MLLSIVDGSPFCSFLLIFFSSTLSCRVSYTHYPFWAPDLCLAPYDNPLPPLSFLSQCEKTSSDLKTGRSSLHTLFLFFFSGSRILFLSVDAFRFLQHFPRVLDEAGSSHWFRLDPAVAFPCSLSGISIYEPPFLFSLVEFLLPFRFCLPLPDKRL